MNQIAEMLRVWAIELVAAAGPTVVSAAAGAVAGGLLALALALLVGKIAARGRRGSVRVASLAARGASRAEIARRTGISQDAVGMLLHVRSAPRGRRNLPVAARIAAPHRPRSRRGNRDVEAQVTGIQEDMTVGANGLRSARPLPSARARTNRLTRAGRAA